MKLSDLDLSTEEFRSKYNQLKSEGKTDKEVAESFGFDTNYCIWLLKKMLEIPVKRVRKNSVKLSEAELRIADANGIGRRLALRRVRELGWCNQDAIYTPRGKNAGNYGRTDEQIKADNKERQKEYYNNRKKRVLRK